MSEVPDPRQFYVGTMARNGIDIRDEEADLVKIAEASNLDLRVIKLAQRYYEQMQKDEIPYESDLSRRDDAVKMAESYYTMVDEEVKQAEAKADDLLAALAEAAEKWAEKNSEDVPALELVKAAGLQAESAMEIEKQAAADRAAMEKKAAEEQPEEPEQKEAEAQEGDEPGKAQAETKQANNNMYFEGVSDPHHLNVSAGLDQVAQAFAKEHGHTSMDGIHDHLAKKYNLDPNHPDTAFHIHNMLDAQRQGTAQNFSEMHNAAQTFNNSWSSKLKRNKVPLIAGGAAVLGLGAKYLWDKHKANKRKKEWDAYHAQQNQQSAPQHRPDGAPAIDAAPIHPPVHGANAAPA
jgi:hypothetical protein